VGVDGVYNSGSPFTIKVNATSLVVYGNSGYNSHSMIQSSGEGANITSVRWRLKVYMRP